MNMTFKMTISILAGAAAFATAAAPSSAVSPQKASLDAWNKLDKAARARMRKDFAGGFANYWHTNIDAAREMYESVLTNDVCLNSQKIAALRQVAQMHLEATRDGEAALAAMDRAFALPGLTDAERTQAEQAKLDLRRLMRLEPPDPAKAKGEKAKLPLAELERSAHELDIRYNRPSDKGVSVYFDACLDAGYEAFFTRVPALLKEFDARYPKANYWKIAWGAPNTYERGRNPSNAQLDRRFAASFLALMESAPTNAAISAEKLFAYANGRPGLKEKSRIYAERVVAQAAETKVNPKTLAAAKKFLAFDGVDTTGKIVAACRAWLAEGGKANDRAALAKLIGEQAQDHLKAGNEKLARELWAERLEIVPERGQSKLDCPYWKDAPHDIRGVIESEFYRKAPKGLFAHKYGDNLKFLIETDSAITSREMTTDKGEKFRPTELFAFCDAQGVKLLIRAYLDNMAAVKAGEAGVPGYETYLATGVDDPYHCIMFNPREGGKAGDSFITQYDNGSGYRNLQDKLGNLRYDNLYLDDGVATLISIPWTSTTESIPSRSPVWYFEAINWAHGGLSWGGSESVHHRSRCGELTFTGIDEEALAAIRRTVLRKARAALAEAKNPRSGGCVETCSDPVLGDQAFYLAVVKPYVARIEADLARATKDASPAVLAEVFASGSVDDAINIDYRIALLRTQWLEENLTR